MPTLTSARLVHLQKLCHKYRIEFLGEMDSSEWPECHQDTLNDVKEVASRRYDAYATNPASFETDPWKMERKSHALVLAKSAGRSGGRNESTWRHTCESFIFSRLSSEVCCPDCRKRVWRSEIEVSRNESNSSSIALRNRQKARQPCICPRARRSPDALEAIGLNQIFNFRTDEAVRHDPEVTKELGKREKPDRVYGLRKTRNIELLLYDIAAQGSESGVNTSAGELSRIPEFQSIRQPMNAKGDIQLFPFLVLEAKAGASDEWFATNMQTAFSIRTFLETQRQLFSAVSTRSDWKPRPMAWFFSNKGEDWRLCAAYTEDAAAEPDCIGTVVYRVIDVWHGCITSRDGALQLLLLVDYVFDWARDRYRPDIIGALRIGACGESDVASEVCQDTDILSTVPFDRSRQSPQVTEDVSGLSDYLPNQSSFTALDSPAGACRHATFVESRYYCLYITADNVNTFLRTIGQKRAQPLCRLILGHMSESIMTDADTLDAIEEEWTGVCRSSSPSYSSQAQKQFCVVMSFATYLSAQWHQVRELSVIAITTDAWKIVRDAAEFKKKLVRPDLSDYYNKSEVVQVLEGLLAGSPGQVLHAAITRTSYRIVGGSGRPHALGVEIDSGSLRDLVYYMYAWLKRGGSLEPNEPYFRLSKRFDQQHLRKDHAAPFPLIQEDPLQISSEGCVLITATCHPKDSAGRRGPQFCAYLTEGGPAAPEAKQLAAIVKKALETRDVYHTTRTSIRGPTFTALIQQGQSGDGFWNMRGLYGVYSQDLGFLDLLRRLGSESPVTLGASRSPDACGSQLYRRNLFPWIDPRYFFYNQSRVFLLHKLFTREISFWRSVARERERSGVSCCGLCAALGEHNICMACEQFLADDNQYDWFRNAVLGEPPLQMKDLSEEDIETRLRMDSYPYLKVNIAPRPHGFDNYDGNVEWSRMLDFYSKLDEPFNDIAELAPQWQRFHQYCDKRGSYRFLGRARNRKRKQSDRSDAEMTDDSTKRSRAGAQ